MAIVGANDHGNSRPPAARETQAVGVCTSDGVKSGFGRAVAPRKAKIPIVNVESAAVPFVGPTKYESSRAAGCIRAAYQPVKRMRLFGLTVTPAVQPNLGENQGTLARQILQPCEITLPWLPRFQIDVETNQIEKGKVQIFRGRKVHIRNQPSWTF